MKNGVVIFVEGETEKVFYNEMIEYMIKRNAGKQVKFFKVDNLKGIGRFESKLVGKFKNGFKNRYKDYNFDVACAYDTDVFEYKSKPPVNWTKKTSELKNAGAKKVVRIKAKHMIEDWFLDDLHGLCSYLKVKEKMPRGKDGNEKMINLFKQKNKIYVKGTYTEKFINSLDMGLIYQKEKKELEKLEKILFE